MNGGLEAPYEAARTRVLLSGSQFGVMLVPDQARARAAGISSRRSRRAAETAAQAGLRNVTVVNVGIAIKQGRVP